MITDRIGRHEVLLPLLIDRLMQKDKPIIAVLKAGSNEGAGKQNQKQGNVDHFSKKWEADVFPTYQFIHDLALVKAKRKGNILS